MGEEGIYDNGGVGSGGERGTCACSPHHVGSNDLNLRELDVIEIGDRWGIFPM